MKSQYSNSHPEQAVNLVELWRKCANALDRNRNQRQVLILLMHYSGILREEAQFRISQSAQTRLSWQAKRLRAEPFRQHGFEGTVLLQPQDRAGEGRLISPIL